MDRINYLLQQYWQDESSEEEIAELLDYVSALEDPAPIVPLLRAHWETIQPVPETAEVDWPSMLASIVSVTNPRRPRRLFLWFRLAAAILIPFTVIAGVWWMTKPKKQPPITQDMQAGKQSAAITAADIAPGGNRATLSLTDGRIVILDSLSAGEAFSQSGAEVVKQEDGLLRYQPKRETTDATGYNMITTPRGGQYQVMLPDGSQVWLNAASSLRFPTRFHNEQRVVELTGEAYFEIRHDPEHPFIALASGSRIEVTGTHFNVMAYDDEPSIRTTLLEGGVKVVSKDGKDSTLLIPGQQAVARPGGPVRKSMTDVEAAVAWKNGITSFNNTSLSAVLRSLARWYDIDITYENRIPQQTFTGGISRYVNLSEVLDMLRYAGLEFRMSGRTLVVSN